MKKRVLSILLALSLVTAFVPITAFATPEGDANDSTLVVSDTTPEGEVQGTSGTVGDGTEGQGGVSTGGITDGDQDGAEPDGTTEPQGVESNGKQQGSGFTALMLTGTAVESSDSNGSDTHTHAVCGKSDCKKHDSKVWTAWDAKDGLPTSAGYYYLTEDVTLSAAWQPSSDTYLCLNGHTITCTSNADAIKVKNNCTITDCHSGEGVGKITHANGASGSGVCVESGIFTLWNGIITGNTAGAGAGVWVGGDSARFFMYGGSITGNTATRGGGVFILSGVFNVSGDVKVTGNTGKDGAANNVYLDKKQIGVTDTLDSTGISSSAVIGITAASPKDGPRVVSGCTKNMSVFSSDNASYDVVSDGDGYLKLASEHVHCICGGDDESHGEKIKWTAWTDESSLPTAAGNYYLATDVYLSSEWGIPSNVNLCLNGKSIYGADMSSTVTVHLEGNLAITDCHTGDDLGKITHPDDGKAVGGVGVDVRGAFTLWNGSITGNKAGVYSFNSKSTFVMNGGRITGNERGVQTIGTFQVSGNPVISGNSYNGKVENVYLSTSNPVITVDSENPLGSSAKIGITAEEPDSNPIVIKGTTNTTGFFADDSSYDFAADGNALRLQKHVHRICGVYNCDDASHGDILSWTPVSSLSDITADGNYRLSNDVEIDSTWECPYNVSLCLNGHAIAQTADVDAVKVASGKTLTITDCRGTGKITHKEGAKGCGVDVEGTLTLWNGSITGNNAYINKNNYAGGVRVQNGATFNMNGGSITGNTAMYGAGVDIKDNGTVSMSGGSITGNIASGNGGGVYKEGKLNVSGSAVVSGNTLQNSKANEANNVYLPSNYINIENAKAMSEDASIGVNGNVSDEGRIVVKGTSSTTGFFSDDATYELQADEANNLLKLVKPTYVISGVKLLANAGGSEITGDSKSKVYDGQAVAYEGGSFSPEAAGASLVYTWQQKDGDGYKDIAGNQAPKAAGDYRLLVTLQRGDSQLAYQGIPFSISAKELTVTGLKVADKVYDGTTDAVIEGTPALSGKVAADKVSLVNGTPKFQSAEAGTNIPIVFDPGFSLSGEDAANYTLTQPTGITANITEKPAVTYTVTFDSKGGSAVTAQTIAQGGKAVKPADPIKAGYDFDGWFLENGTAYNFEAQVTDNLTLYAHWTEKPVAFYTVTFDSDGGSAVEPQDVAPGEQAVKPADPVKTGFDFKGWFLKDGTAYDFSAAVTGNLTLYAHWAESAKPEPAAKHTVTFDTADGTAIAPQEVADGDCVAKPADPTREGFDFKGWYLQSGEAYDFATPVTSDLTLYAHWGGNGGGQPSGDDQSDDQGNGGDQGKSQSAADSSENAGSSAVPATGDTLVLAVPALFAVAALAALVMARRQRSR